MPEMSSDPLRAPATTTVPAGPIPPADAADAADVVGIADTASQVRPVIRVAGVVLRRANGDVLTVRKRATRMFMFPGGKPEAGETPLDTAVREVREELGVSLAPGELHEIGQWHTDAANEPGHALHSHVFVATTTLAGTPVPAAEIAELRWQPVAGVEDTTDLAPLARWFAIPAVRDGTAPGSHTGC